MSLWDAAAMHARTTLGFTANYGHPRHDEYMGLINEFIADHVAECDALCDLCEGERVWCDECRYDVYTDGEYCDRGHRVRGFGMWHPGRFERRA